MHDTGARESSENSVEVKGISKDVRKHLRNELVMGDDDKEGDRQVKDPHDRNKDACDL